MPLLFGLLLRLQDTVVRVLVLDWDVARRGVQPVVVVLMLGDVVEAAGHGASVSSSLRMPSKIFCRAT